jgi:hypothetical protein
MSNQNKRLDEALVDRLENVYFHLGVQMAAPFYILSKAFLTASNQSTDVVGVMKKKESNKYEREMFAISTSEMPPEVYSFLEQKTQANELWDYVTKLVEQDLHKPDKEELRTLFDSFRNEFLGEINLLKKELALRPVVAANDNESRPVIDHEEEVDGFKEGQLLESDRVTGTIKEVIDVHF